MAVRDSAVHSPWGDDWVGGRAGQLAGEPPPELSKA
jgi:hypothetical protein